MQIDVHQTGLGHPAVDRFIKTIGELPEVKSVLLLGSAARGEASLRKTKNSIEYFSDLEFVIISNSLRLTPVRKKIQKEAREAERKLANPNPLFHIDFLVRHRTRISRFPPIIFTFELKENGLVLCGRDIRSEVPLVSIDNLDFRNTREIFFKRLFYILVHIPQRLFCGELSESEKVVFGYVLSRNALDLTTILLPEAGVLLPSYRERVSFLARSYEEMPFCERFGRSLPSLLHDCLRMRLELEFADCDLKSLYDDVLGYFDLVPGFWLPQGGESEELVRSMPTLFNEWPITRGEWYYLTRSVMKILRKTSPKRTLHWLLAPKKAWICSGLLAMHRALRAWIHGDMEKANEEKARSTCALERLTLVMRDSSVRGFEAEWLALRQKWTDFYCFYLLADSESAQRRLELALNWPDDGEVR